MTAFAEAKNEEPQDLPKDALKEIIDKQDSFIKHLQQCLSSQNEIIETLIKENNT